MVHRIFRHCLLDLHCCMVVSKMTLTTSCSSLFLFPFYTSYSALAILQCSETLSHIPLQEVQKIIDVISKKNSKIGTARYKEYNPAYNCSISYKLIMIITKCRIPNLPYHSSPKIWHILLGKPERLFTP